MIKPAPAGEGCGIHSWIGASHFPCCYSSSNEVCMKNKLREFSDKMGPERIDKDAFELSFFSGSGATPGDALAAWKGRPRHSAIMNTQGDWAVLKRVGCWYHEKWANCWFSQ